MSEIANAAIYTDLQPNSSSEIINPLSDATETSLSSTDNGNPTTTTTDIDEPPTKKCKITTTDKPRLLEERIGSILSCCICLDLSTLPIYQVNNSEIPIEKNKISFFLLLSV